MGRWRWMAWGPSWIAMVSSVFSEAWWVVSPLFSAPDARVTFSLRGSNRETTDNVPGAEISNKKSNNPWTAP